MHAHTKLEFRTRAVTCTMECKATHTCTRSFTYPVLSHGLYESSAGREQPVCVRRSVYHSPHRDEGKLSLWPAPRVYRVSCPLLATITLGVLHMIEVRQQRLLRSSVVQHLG